jgi:hypothetical protein
MKRRFALFAVTVFAALGLDARPFTGTFVADARPSWLAFLSLTQAADGVKGVLTVATPDDHGMTKSDVVAVEGSVDGNTISIQTKTFLNLGSVTLAGRLLNGTLALSMPDATGRILSMKFVRGTEAKFNAVCLLGKGS